MDTPKNDKDKSQMGYNEDELNRIDQLNYLLVQKGISPVEYDALNSALWHFSFFRFTLKNNQEDPRQYLDGTIEKFNLFKGELEARHENTDEIQKIIDDFDKTLIDIRTHCCPNGQ